MPHMKLPLAIACALAFLTGCPDAKPPKDPTSLPTPKADAVNPSVKAP